MRDPDRSRAVPAVPAGRPALHFRRLLLGCFGCILGCLLGGLGCGKEIGDDCLLSSDCSPDGDRVCVIDMSTNSGYCTIQGCDFDTCPDESVCVRFFTGSFGNRECNRLTEDDGSDSQTDDCSFDELCSLTPDECTTKGYDAADCGRCVPRSAESRFCMKTCDSDGDCRDDYQCRDLEDMKANGGEPVLPPGQKVDERSPKFCAAAPPS
jgi:hypothetical protein